MDQSDSSDVQLHLYQLSSRNSEDTIWQIGLVVHGREYHQTQTGITTFIPGSTELGAPSRVEIIGETELPYSVFLDYILSLSHTKYKVSGHNISQLIGLQTDLADDCCQFLCGSGLPKYLLQNKQNSLSSSPSLEELFNKLNRGGLSLISNLGITRLNAGEEDPELEDLENQIKSIRERQRILDERRNSLNTKEDKKRKKKKEKVEPEKGEMPGLEAATSATGQSARPASQSLHTRSHTHRPGSSHPSILRSASCQLPESADPPASRPCTLFRNKSLKKVSFDERKEVIEEDLAGLPSPSGDPEAEDDLPPLEEVQHEGQLSCAYSTQRSRSPVPPFVRMAGTEEDIELNADGEQVPKKERKPHVKGITFREFDHVKDFEDLVRTVVTLCNQEEQERLREMEDWIVKKEGTWVLAEGFNNFLGKVMHDEKWPSEGRVAMLRLMAYGAGEDDIVLILHMDRKDHLLMNYAQKFDRLPVKEQESLAMLFCNLFETGSASEWLLYISEWEAPGGGLPLSNIRVTTKVAVNALLGESSQLVDYGSALMANLATKEIFDDVCSELAMAILQFFQGKPSEEHVYRCMKALHKFCTIGGRDVPQLVKMIGPDPAKFRGLSKRVDEELAPLSAKLATVPMF